MLISVISEKIYQNYLFVKWMWVMVLYFLLYRQYLEEYIYFSAYIGVTYTQLINVPAN